MYDAESMKVANANPPAVLSSGVMGNIILLASVCDSTYRLLPIREAHWTLGV